MPPSCALLGRFAITARVSLLWRHTRLMRNVGEDAILVVWLVVLAITFPYISEKSFTDLLYSYVAFTKYIVALPFVHGVCSLVQHFMDDLQ